MAGRLPPANLRLAVVRSVSKTFVQCNFLGHLGELPFQCPITQPYASNGGGIIVGVQPGAVVLVADGPS